MRLTSNFKGLLLRCGIIVLIVIVVSVIYNLVSPVGLPFVTPYRKVVLVEKTQKIPVFASRKDLKSRSGVQKQELLEVDIDQIEKFTIFGGAIIVDTRSYTEYCSGHIPGAFSVPYEDFLSDKVNIDEIDSSEFIILYCEGPKCNQSVDMAVQLIERGFQKVAFYPGGWEEWVNQNKPIVKGGKP